ncbi:MAG: Uncharacterized protein G01um101413_417 [Parcubacteria group bacterium Gr01-1014_13]|nr:MAG: Uncharacterized protein G01um101413_417 [Parcubacteria group bacterium Gr01-1014_13]
MSITAHCLVKNEENFIYYAIKSVINFVDQVMVFDTGSTDKTVAIIQSLVKEYPNKIIFEEKGVADGKRHTELRQEMVDRTKTDWFMILDGDEIWTARVLSEAKKIITENAGVECLVAPFYLCVGDIYHTYYRKGVIKILGKKDFHYPRFIKITSGVHWQGDYNKDTLLDKDNEEFCKIANSRFLTNRYWHTTHLRRSSKDDSDYSSGGNRKVKRRLTYFIIGRKINEPIPEVLQNKNEFKMGAITSFVNFNKLIVAWVINRL